LKYWEFIPASDETSGDEAANEQSKDNKHVRGQGSSDTQRTRVDQDTGTRSRWGFKSWGKKSKANQRASENARASQQQQQLEPLPVSEGEKQKGKEKPAKKMPVCLLFLCKPPCAGVFM
jgi:hypothetical protein